MSDATAEIHLQLLVLAAGPSYTGPQGAMRMLVVVAHWYFDYFLWRLCVRAGANSAEKEGVLSRICFLKMVAKARHRSTMVQEALDACEDVICGLGPDERLEFAVVYFDVLADGLFAASRLTHYIRPFGTSLSVGECRLYTAGHTHV